MRTESAKIEPLAACRLTWSAAPCEYTMIFAGTLNTGSDTDRGCGWPIGVFAHDYKRRAWKLKVVSEIINVTKVF